jgi:hypothetical protein
MAGGVAEIECHEEEGPMKTVAEDEAKEEEAAEVGWVACGAGEDADDISVDGEENDAPDEACESDANT